MILLVFSDIYIFVHVSCSEIIINIFLLLGQRISLYKVFLFFILGEAEKNEEETLVIMVSIQ